MGQKVCPFAVFCTCAGRKLGAGLSGVQHTFTLILSFSLSCVEPGNDMSLSEVLSALTMIMLHCYSLEYCLILRQGKRLQIEGELQKEWENR